MKTPRLSPIASRQTTSALHQEGFAAPDLGFAHTTLNRLSDQRDDEAFLQAARQHPDARVLVFAGDVPILHGAPETADPLFNFTQLRGTEAMMSAFLGFDGQAPRFAQYFPASHAEDLEKQGFVLGQLRALAIEARLSPALLGAMGMARSLFHWHQNHKFCGACGHKNLVKAAGWRCECTGCGAQHFPRTDPVVIMLIHRGDYALLGRQSRFPQGTVSTLAGFLEPGETIEDAVRREGFEEAGVKIGAVKLIANQPWPFPASLMLGCHAEAITETLTIDYKELELARWFHRDEVKQMRERTHPEGFVLPPRMAIARHLVRSWLETT